MSNIWVAAADNDLDTIKNLIEKEKLDINCKDSAGYTPLHAAASYGHIELSQWLLDHGADINIRDEDGDTPLHVTEDPAMALKLIGLGADRNIKNSEGQTPQAKADAEGWPQDLVDTLRP